VVEPAHYSLLFAKKPRAQVMLYREALLQLGPSAKWYLSEVSHRRRAHLRDEVVGIYTLYQQIGAERLLAAMDYATERSAYGVDYLRALVELASRATPATWPPVLSPPPAALWPAAPVAPAATTPGTPVSLAGVPALRIPRESDQRFRGKPISDSAVFDHPAREARTTVGVR
jgi:hypothetical protein